MVLGASGYLGGALVVELRRRFGEGNVVPARSVHELSIPPSDVDVIVNCVGYFGAERRRLYSANVEHVRAVGRAARDAGARVIHVSSSAVFDGVTRGTLDERTTPLPRSAYGLSKLQGERELAALVPGARAIRPAKVFGGADERRRLHALIAHVRAGRPLPVPRGVNLFANFVWLAGAVEVIADEVSEPILEPVGHVASPLPWSEFLELVSLATGCAPRRMPLWAERLLGMTAATARSLPPSLLSRRFQQVVELWDERVFRDSRMRLGIDSVREGIREVADSVRP